MTISALAERSMSHALPQTVTDVFIGKIAVNMPDLDVDGLMVVLHALRFAAEEHGDQRRKYEGGPYIFHPMTVAERVSRVPAASLDMIVASLLHDTREDRGTSREEIVRRFGARVDELVDDLTDVSKPEDGIRAVRKEIDRQHTARASPQAKTIKLADIAHNAESIIKHDPGFAKVWVPEKRLSLDVLHEGDPVLFGEAVAALGELKE